MPVPTSANYVFLPWVRQGAASGIQTADTLGAAQAGAVAVSAKLSINGTDDINRQVRLYGPGEVTGLDPRQVVRIEPRHLASDFEPNYFPAIEFDRPDFPWLFTPAKSGGNERLRPWLCLVVVRKQQGVTVRMERGMPLPQLEIAAPARPGDELPDLSESWAWAHGQVTGSQLDSASVKHALAGDPALNVSRLLCPRRLDPLTDYLACVVPAFELGRKAGLGLPIQPAEELRLDPAWASGAQAPAQITLPVYYQWEFRTGAGGDFEELVRLLEPRQMPEEAGKRLLDISQPGFKIAPPPPAGLTLELEGALRVPEAKPSDWPKVTQMPFQTALKPILDAPWKAMTEGADPLVAPPIYGCWQAARHTVNLAPVAPLTALPWLDELNLDPRHRGVAALGTQVVQTQQEPLMASAWAQLGEIERINQLLRQAQFGRAVNAVYHARDFSRFSQETLLKVVSPAQSRVVVEGTNLNNVATRALLSQRIIQSPIPANAVSAPLRRLTRPRGAISSRFRSTAAAATQGSILVRLNTTTFVAAQKPQAGLVTLNNVSDQIAALSQVVRYERATVDAVTNQPPNHLYRIVAEGLPTPPQSDRTRLPDSADAAAFRNAAKDHQAYLGTAFISFLIFPVPQMNLADTRSNLLQSVNPEKTIAARVQASIKLTPGAQRRDDPLEPVLDAPEFPQPMYEALRDLSQEYLFPGLEFVPPNTVTLLETNPGFVESFLVGLNNEMGRELLWRNYPTDQRGTYFRQFWDSSAGDEQVDIAAINHWGDKQLGQNARAGGKLVLLLRGELLRRYPNSVIYAVRAVTTGGQRNLSPNPADERHPLFRGTLNPDVTFLGFDLTADEAMADPGWFFVIQQQPTEPRFGLDVAEFDQPLPELKTWNDLSWRHLANTPEALQALTHASVAAALPEVDKAKWGRNAAHQAYITLQRPVRIAIHASEMIPKK